MFAAIRSTSVVLSLLVALSTPLLWGAPARAGTTISQAVPGVCAPVDPGLVITQPGDYALGGDITCAAGDGIDIESSGVTLHLNGFSISGTCMALPPSSTSVGIHVNPTGLPTLTMVRILGNGTITGFQNGIEGDHSAGSFAKFVTITSACPGAFGILIDSFSSQWKLQKDTITNVGIGIGLFGDDNDLVLNSVSGSNTFTGILVESMFNTIVNNTASMNNPANSRGIDVIGGGSNDLHANTTDNNFDGIVVESGSSDNNITGNTSFNNAGFDMRDENNNCDNNKWRGNHFTTSESGSVPVTPSPCIN
jgi:hypothetical protein